MNAPQLPKYHETFIPILSVLSDGRVLQYNDLRRKVRDQFYSDLPPELLAKETKAGDQLILNRIGFGKAYLKMAKLVSQPERAMVQITDKGRKVLEAGSYTLTDIMSDPDFLAHKQGRAQGEESGGAIGDSTPEELIDSGVAELRTLLQDELLERLKSVDPYEFEKIILRLLKRMGYGDFVETSKSNDGGIDGVINQDQLGIDKIYIQAKRFTESKVGRTDIQKFIGAMAGSTTRGVFVTTTSFNDNAIEAARGSNFSVILIDGARLASLMIDHGVGVQIKNTYEIKEIDEDFFVEGSRFNSTLWRVQEIPR